MQVRSAVVCYNYCGRGGRMLGVIDLHRPNGSLHGNVMQLYPYVQTRYCDCIRCKPVRDRGEVHGVTVLRS
ncbi:hypothetical protein F444_08737 [Phytophthora nicotianae P1976]|uniref:Uncharacterized protein n=1 Tax=Phytophthora nicotianae P1976 TaxID=1317066 RepID=A0A081AA05_PHYNI|nr:hypothetical protein F444_08737 [Phytophthora nicotianae P1976]